MGQRQQSVQLVAKMPMFNHRVSCYRVRFLNFPDVFGDDGNKFLPAFLRGAVVILHAPKNALGDCAKIAPVQCEQVLAE